MAYPSIALAAGRGNLLQARRLSADFAPARVGLACGAPLICRDLDRLTASLAEVRCAVPFHTR